MAILPMFPGSGGLFGPQEDYVRTSQPGIMDIFRGMASRGETAPGLLDSGQFLLDAFMRNANKMADQSGARPQTSNAEAFLNDSFAAPSQPVAPAPAAPGLPSAQVFARPDAWTMQQQAPQKPQAPIDQTVYGSPSIPPAAQPAQAQMPPQMQGPGIGDRISAGFHGFTNAGSPMQALSSLVGGLASGERTDPAGASKVNQQTMALAARQYFMGQGMDANQATALAQVVALNPKIADELFKPPASIEAAIARQMGNGGRMSGDPFEALRRLKQAEATGTKAGGVIGETQATAEMNLPSAVAQAQETLRLTAELRKHPGRNQVGWHDVLGSAPLIPSTKGYDAQRMLDQIKGGAFLEAFKSLKGGGQITEVEGKKATDAIARMDRASSKAEFEKALSDFEGVVRLGIDRANQQANKPAPFNFQGNSAWQEVKPGVRIRQVQ